MITPIHLAVFSYPFQYESLVATSEAAQALKPFHEFPRLFWDAGRVRCFQMYCFAWLFT